MKKEYRVHAQELLALSRTRESSAPLIVDHFYALTQAATKWAHLEEHLRLFDLHHYLKTTSIAATDTKGLLYSYFLDEAISLLKTQSPHHSLRSNFLGHFFEQMQGRQSLYRILQGI